MVIVQNNIGNRFSPTTIVVASVTSKTSRPLLPTHVELKNIIGLAQPSLLLLEQIRTIDRKRLKEYIGTLDESLMKKVDEALSVSIGLKDEQQ